MSKAPKLVALALIAVVLAAGASYWLFSPKPPSEIVTYTSEGTSLSLSRRTSDQTQTTFTMSSTATGTATTLWLNVSATEPVSYYLALLESNRTEPYVQLAKELRKLPDLENATAVAKIASLTLNATNPEVKGAFELMIKGGTPSQSEFSYAVPNYNTELQVLYWLALQDEFKKDDTLALTIAMVNGLWVTMGDDQVREAVRKDTSDLLAFFRETNEIQRARGYGCLEDYPLEAKVALAWAGAQSPTMAKDHALVLFRDRSLDLRSYQWDTISVNTLRRMRDLEHAALGKSSSRQGNGES